MKLELAGLSEFAKAGPKAYKVDAGDVGRLAHERVAYVVYAVLLESEAVLLILTLNQQLHVFPNAINIVKLCVSECMLIYLQLGKLLKENFGFFFGEWSHCSFVLLCCVVLFFTKKIFFFIKEEKLLSFFFHSVNSSFFLIFKIIHTSHFII